MRPLATVYIHFQITGANGTYDSQLTLSGEVYPAEIHEVSNSNFNNQALVIDPTQPFTVTWNSFADQAAGDAMVFQPLRIPTEQRCS